MALMKRRFSFLLLGLLTQFAVALHAADAFTIEDIRIEGLQRISAGTVFNYLPVKVGDSFDQRQSAESIKSLFKTGFFKDVRIEQEGATLVVIVEERPSISRIALEGNKDISSDDLKKALKGVGLTEGKVFDRSVLEKVEQELRRQYYSRGKYGVRIESRVTEEARNRVAVDITISEGKVATIQQINIVGNNSFSDETLAREFELSTGNLLSFYTKDNQYSKQKFSADLERLRSYYLDRGYINSQIESTQVALTPDKKDIYLTVNLKEGDVYKVSDVKVTGKVIVRPPEITPLVRIGPGDTFSRRLATETQKAISDRLGDEGYIFANVNMVPEINDEKKTVTMTFFVDPGKQVYVRRINFTGNTKTRDEVLRREMRQMEAAWASSSKIERSKTRLERLGYFQEVNVETPAVSGTADQIDVNYKVVEKSSGSIMAGVGYSQLQGIIFNANVTQDNVFGTGRRVAFNFNNSNINTMYQISHFNPYVSLDGISGGFDATYMRQNAYTINLANYTSDNASIGGNLGLPLGEFDSLRFNLDGKYTKIKTSSTTSEQVLDFIHSYGGADASEKGFYYVPVALGWVHDTLNRAIFPTEGGAQRVSVMGTLPVLGTDDSVNFYKASFKLQQYFPLAKDLTLLIQGEVAYGDGYSGTQELPFWENYFAGGPQSMRGFYPSSMGPRTLPNASGSGGDLSLGGSSKMVGTVELLAPIPFIEDSKNMRIGAFVDVGNVYCGTFTVPSPTSSNSYCYAPAKGDFLRYSPGLVARWLSPFGNLGVSIAHPINTVEGDRTQSFQFSFGQAF